MVWWSHESLLRKEEEKKVLGDLRRMGDEGGRGGKGDCCVEGL